MQDLNCDNYDLQVQSRILNVITIISLVTIMYLNICTKQGLNCDNNHIAAGDDNVSQYLLCIESSGYARMKK